MTHTSDTSSNYVWTSTATTATIIALPQETEEQRVEREQQVAALQERCAREAAEREQAKSLAEQRAFELLRLALSDEEMRQLDTEKHFEVRGSSGTVYRIRKGRSANIDVMDNGRVTHRLCFHPQIYCPDYDTMLAQKLLLETDEDAALRMANVLP
jgi:hypothetical protein